jgi:hypothetical protein|tara:strand:+ start:1740 stop:2093 length:354 start_codon:yes stop_codon:yes gene_type:complete
MLMEDKMDIREFFKDCLKDFDKPDNWEDVSYYNDVCPSFECNGYQIFVDHPDPEQRELGEGSFRFGVMISFEYGVMGWNLATDDFNEVLREIEVPYMTRPLHYDREEYLKEEARKSA